MKVACLCICMLILVLESLGQLVRRKDYDAAFAIQAGGEVGMLTIFHNPKLGIRPIAGLKMTFPFTRKWFLGSEVNYSNLKYTASEKSDKDIAGQDILIRGKQKADFDLKQIQVPVYLKYRLNSNKASVIFGFYGAYVFDTGLTISGNDISEEDRTNKIPKEIDLSEKIEKWHAGISIGYEHQIVKHLNVMCRINAGLKEVVKNKQFFKDKLLPIQACITISYDVFRIGDCGCD